MYTVIVFDHERCVKTGVPVCITWSTIVLNARGDAVISKPDIAACWLPGTREMFRQWLLDPNTILVAQNAAGDLHELGLWYELVDEVCDKLEADLVRCTMIRQRLLDIAAPAEIRYDKAKGRQVPMRFGFHFGLGEMVRVDKGEYSKTNLRVLTYRWCAHDLSKGEESWQLRFGELLGVPTEQWPIEALRYALGDPWWTAQVFVRQATRDHRFPFNVWGKQWWSPVRAECDQIRGSMGLYAMQKEGLRIDRTRVKQRRRALQMVRDLAAEFAEACGVLSRAEKLEREATERRRLAAQEAAAKRAEKMRLADLERIRLGKKIPKRKPKPPDWQPKPRTYKPILKPGQSYKRHPKAIRMQVVEGLARPLIAAGMPRDLALIEAYKGAERTPTEQIKTGTEVLAEVSSPINDATEERRDLAALLSQKLLDVAVGWVAPEDPNAAGGIDIEAAARGAGRLLRALRASPAPGLAALMVAEKARKFDNDFFARLDRDGYACAAFNYILETGRASAFGDLRQNMPRGGGVRECLIPDVGEVLLVCDYASIELVSLAYVWDKLISVGAFGEHWKGRESSLTRALKAGLDPHLLFATQELLHIDYEQAAELKEVCDACVKKNKGRKVDAKRDMPDGVHVHEWYESGHCGICNLKHDPKPTGRKIVIDWGLYERIIDARIKAKAGNFGFPGGMKPKKFRIAKRKEGLILTLEQCVELYQHWQAVWPEVGPYFEWIQGMVSAEGHAVAITVGGGLVRSGCTYTQLGNHGFQACTAKGAKVALWRLYLACYAGRKTQLQTRLASEKHLTGIWRGQRVVFGMPASTWRTAPVSITQADIDACPEPKYPRGQLADAKMAMFIHDEVVLRSPAHLGSTYLARQKTIMREGMQTAMPGMPIGVDATQLNDRWRKT